MTVPDPTAPTAEVALTGVVRRHRLLRVTGGTACGSTWVCACGETVRTPGVTRDWAETLHARHVAAAVVAAVRGMSVETLAELIGGEVEDFCLPGECAGGPRCGSRRVVGPWRAEP